ncbi:hypothetical protein C8J55DRAFT_553663 [Lentinula edodes]|uniref:Uncharacterized protein n=1 Tax=Lentinula lateritia TaxID=40482 RepID=A0A9W9E0W2_9AGAR|nr:hypothetical protein C8J55DRAFT_553663 [Lentinula edodes]
MDTLSYISDHPHYSESAKSLKRSVFLIGSTIIVGAFLAARGVTFTIGLPPYHALFVLNISLLDNLDGSPNESMLSLQIISFIFYVGTASVLFLGIFVTVVPTVILFRTVPIFPGLSFSSVILFWYNPTTYNAPSHIHSSPKTLPSPYHTFISVSNSTALPRPPLTLSNLYETHISRDDDNESMYGRVPYHPN